MTPTAYCTLGLQNDDIGDGGTGWGGGGNDTIFFQPSDLVTTAGTGGGGGSNQLEKLYCTLSQIAVHTRQLVVHKAGRGLDTLFQDAHSHCSCLSKSYEMRLLHGESWPYSREAYRCPQPQDSTFQFSSSNTTRE